MKSLRKWEREQHCAQRRASVGRENPLPSVQITPYPPAAGRLGAHHTHIYIKHIGDPPHTGDPFFTGTPHYVKCMGIGMGDNSARMGVEIPLESVRVAANGLHNPRVGTHPSHVWAVCLKVVRPITRILRMDEEPIRMGYEYVALRREMIGVPHPVDVFRDGRDKELHRGRRGNDGLIARYGILRYNKRQENIRYYT